MRRLITVIALMTLALPVSAQECTQLDIDYEGTSPYVSSRNPGAEGIRTSIVGHFLNIQYGDADSLGDDLVSVELDGATAATVCPDGTVTLAETPVGDDETAETPVDLGEVYADVQPFIDALLKFRPY